MNEFSMVDAHVHLWDPARLRYAWLDALPSLNRAFALPEFWAAASRSNASKLIVVEGGGAAGQNFAEVDWISRLAEDEPRLKGIVAHAALERGTEARRELEELARRPLVKGVRRSLQGEGDERLFMAPDFIAGVAALEDFGFTFDLCIRHDQLRAATELARRVPGVTFVLDHLGKPGVRAGLIEPWASDLQAFAALPNTACKISGLTTEADWENWNRATLKFYFDWALECFSFGRVLFGGDWPVATLATTFQRWFDVVAECCAMASDADRAKLFQNNAERIYRV